MTHTLADLDAMSIEDAQALSFEERDALLDLIIADGRHQTTDLDSYRVGLYGDYFDEDLTRMLKVKAIKVHVRGTTASGFDRRARGGVRRRSIPSGLPARAAVARGGGNGLQSRRHAGSLPDRHGQLADAE